jgi:xanthine/uracil permease
MTANATIVVEELADVLMIPTWVVRVDNNTGQTYVNQQVGEKIVRTDVELGVRHEGVAHVLGGLSEGDEAIWVQESGFGFRRQ